MELDLKVGALMHYFGQTIDKDLPVDLDTCARDVNIDPRDHANLTFLLLCLYGRYDFICSREMEVALKGTKEVIRLAELPTDIMCDGTTLEQLLVDYDRSLHPENHPPPRDLMMECLTALDGARDRLKEMGVRGRVVSTTHEGKFTWCIEFFGEENEEIRAMFPGLLVEFTKGGQSVLVT